LRYTQPGVQRIYRIPGGNWGVWLVAGIGALFCVAAFLLGFIAPPEYQFDEKIYALTLLSGIVLFSAPPFLWQWWRNNHAHSHYDK
ncbi:MAG TPA: hypothetical protein PLD88_03915, partial [Candidatus Berkiella sp.]|nr:hypothetical protein [Candidatus Berkiella sp.]